MKRTINYILLGLAFWFLLFLGWEWWRSYPKVRLTPISFPESIAARLDSLIAQRLPENLIPGIAVGIIKNEKVTYLKAFGYQNLKTKDSLTLQSLIPVASVSKLFTALTLANYAVEKGISIDTSFNSILPGNQRLSSDFEHISLADLLNHTSGLTDQSSIRTLFSSRENRKLSNLPKLLKVPNLENKGVHYADVNFDLIGFLLAAVEGKTFEEVTRDRTLLPSAMKKSGFVMEWPVDPPSASGYQQTFLWKRLEARTLKFERFPSPSSSLVVTAEELSKALLHLSRENMGIFGDELEWLKNGKSTPAGFQKIKIDSSDFIGHFGEQGGFSSLVIYSSELDLAVFLISNARDKSDFRRTMAEEILKIIVP